MTELQLIERASKGDQQAFRALYDANVDRIYRLAYRMAGEEDQDFNLVILDLATPGLHGRAVLHQVRGSVETAALPVLIRIATGSDQIEAELLGDGSLVVTPGPLEQLLDEVLAAVLAHRGRAVRLALDGEERHVRATVQVLASSVHDPTPEAERALLRARAVAETLGGRIAGSLVAEDGLSVVLPRR